MTLDTKSAMFSLILIAEKISEELETYRGCHGVTDVLDNSIDMFAESVRELSTWHHEAFGKE